MAADKMMVMKEVQPVDVADPAEVAQVFTITFAAIAKIREDSNGADAEIRRELAKRTDDLERQLRALQKRGDTSVADLRKIVAALVKWRDRMDKLEMKEDVDEAHERIDTLVVSVQDIERALEKLRQKPGRMGPPGKIPDHEWRGTMIRFENPDGTWGEWVDLRGPSGEGGGGFSLFGSGMGGVRRIRAGTNITVSGDPGEPTISSTATGGGTYTIDEPSGAVNDSNTDFVFSAKPDLIVMNGQTFRENHGWTWNAGTNTATMFAPVGTGGDIFGLLP